MKHSLAFLLFVLLLFSVSCNKDFRKSKAEKIVSEWVGKTIQIPDDIPCSFMGKDTLYQQPETPYKIFVYTDSSGCTGCKAQFFRWNGIIEEINKDLADQVSLQFVIHPQDEDELQFLFRRDNFRYPVYLDRENKVNNLNRFPEETHYNCFLLDNTNKVLLIGSPLINREIWDLYKRVINGETETSLDKNDVPSTTVEVHQPEIEVKDLKTGEESLLVFTLRNTGEAPLLIRDVSASCGCTVPDWDKHPVPSGEEANIKVKIIPENTGYFNKSIRVNCNTEEPVIRLRVKGMVDS